MRPVLLAAGTALGLVIASMLIVAGGRAIERNAAVDAPILVEPITDLPDDLAEPAESEASTGVVAVPVAPPSRTVAPTVVAPPLVVPEELQREAPRGALSELSQALPPKPRAMPADWDGATLFRPMVPASGVVEARGFRVAIAGVETLDAGEICVGGGKSWPCGSFAKGAFTRFLRGRAIACDLPPDSQPGEFIAACKVGSQDIGTWLVSNGWARAVAGEPYVDAGATAERAGKGIFGAAPDTSAPPVPDADTALPTPPPADPTEPLQ